MTNGKNKIEAIFSERNIDEDCDTIARLLSPYREVVRELLIQGNYAKAVTILLEVLESLTYHFVEDEHYNYFTPSSLAILIGNRYFCHCKYQECYEKIRSD